MNSVSAALLRADGPLRPLTCIPLLKYMMSSGSPLGIIAGEGNFPHQVADEAKKQNRGVVAVGFKGHTQTDFLAHVDAFTWLRIGQLGKLVSFFKRQACREIVFAGAINKPKTLGIRPDWRAARLLFQMHSKNDNALLSGLIRFLEKEGFAILAPNSLVTGLRMPAGVLSHRPPSPQECEDIAFGWPLLKQLGSLDIGQCLLVRKGMVVAVEAMEGTNRCIQRAGELAGPGCVVLKAFKPGQEEHVDQPAVGRETIRTMVDSGATCLAVEAEKSIFFERLQALALANKANICVLGCDQAGAFACTRTPDHFHC